MLLRQQLKLPLKLPVAEERRAVNDGSTAARHERLSVKCFYLLLFHFLLFVITATVIVIYTVLSCEAAMHMCKEKNV